VNSSLQRPLPDSTQHSQQTDIQDRTGIQTHNLSRRAATDLHLRPRGHWDRHNIIRVIQSRRMRSMTLVENEKCMQIANHNPLEK